MLHTSLLALGEAEARLDQGTDILNVLLSVQDQPKQCA